MKIFIFTEAFNCGKITAKAIESFLRCNETGRVAVFGNADDFLAMGDIAKESRVDLFYFDHHEQLTKLYKNGHEGTAYVFAQALMGVSAFSYDAFVHFDGDCIFKAPVMEIIESSFQEHDIFGSRRCYKNNPAGIAVDNSLPDTISTYFFGIHSRAIPSYDFETFRRMCGGSYNPLGHPVFDFFDPVTFTAIRNGARIKFIDPNLIGGQNEQGSKKNKYPSNMHLDMGDLLAHFGGVSSGYAYYHGLSKPPESYAKWAVGRYQLFNDLFLDDEVLYDEPTQYGPDGRWVNGGYDESLEIMVNKDLQ